MESIVWFYLFVAAAVLLLAAIVGLVVLAMHLRSRQKNRNVGRENKEIYLSCDMPDYTQTAGFCVEACPGSELLTPTAYWLVDDRIAQIVFDLVPAQRITLRAALHSEEGLPCSEAYRSTAYDSSAVCRIDGVPVTLRQSNSGTVHAAWSRDGVDYLLYGKDLQMNAVGGLLPLFVGGTIVRRSA